MSLSKKSNKVKAIILIIVVTTVLILTYIVSMSIRMYDCFYPVVAWSDIRSAANPEPFKEETRMFQKAMLQCIYEK